MQLDSSKPISVGDIVMLSTYGNEKFIVCRGWYTYKSTRRSGWYFKSIPNGTVIPDFDVDTEDITVVSYASDSDCGCDHVHSDCHHRHHDHCDDDDCCCPAPPAPKDYKGAFVTVNTIDDRNRLGCPYPKDGQLVRVNNVRGEVKYYVWDAENLKWDVFEFPTNSDTLQELEEMETVLGEATQDIKVIKQNSEWILLTDTD